MVFISADMKKIQFLGASGTVTGSSYLITDENDNAFLVDLGLFQESQETENLNTEPLAFDVKKIMGVFLTHAHLDHCGRLPLLIKAGYTGKIFMTEPTKMITQLSLLDSVKIAKEEKKQMLYSEEDVQILMNHVITVSYDNPFDLADCTIVFKNAGHILGSASVVMGYHTGEVVVFSGDLGNSPQDLIEPTEKIEKADVVVIESTYGEKAHPQEDANELILSAVEAVEKTKGVLLIPAFSIERTQEIIHRMYHLRKSGKINKSIPVFVDSPMGIAVVEIFKKFPDYYNEELAQDASPFAFENLVFTKDVSASKAIVTAAGPKIIIAGSGMMSGGRILHHIHNYISLPTTRLLIVGYQAAGTLGRLIEDGEKEIAVYDERLEVNATIMKIETLSSHADQPKLLAWLQEIQGVKKVFITHGEQLQRETLAAKIKNVLPGLTITLPVKGESF